MLNREPDSQQDQLKSEQVTRWLGENWVPEHPEARVFWVPTECTHADALRRFDREFELPNDYKFVGYEAADCPILVYVNEYNREGKIEEQTGAFKFTFESPENTIEVMLLCAAYQESAWYLVAVGAMPEPFVPVWTEFAREVQRLAYAMESSSRVVFIGGNRDFAGDKPTLFYCSDHDDA